MAMPDTQDTGPVLLAVDDSKNAEYAFDCK